MRDRDGTTARTKDGESGGPAGRLRGGDHVAPSRAVALTCAPPPPAQQARTRRSAVPAITLRRWPRLQRPSLVRPPCRASSRRARSQSRALPARHGDGRKRPPLSSDLARQDHRHLSGGRDSFEVPSIDRLLICVDGSRIVGGKSCGDSGTCDRHEDKRAVRECDKCGECDACSGQESDYLPRHVGLSCPM
jgi:hypothetical protein